MKYLCLIYDDESTVGDHVARSEAEAMMGEYFAFTEAIRKSGHYVAGEALQPVQTATTVRVRNGKLSTTDGPFAETKEQLGGFYLIEAKDLNDAIQVASRIPVGASSAASKCGRSRCSSSRPSTRGDSRARTRAAYGRRSTPSTAPSRAASSPR